MSAVHHLTLLQTRETWPTKPEQLEKVPQKHFELQYMEAQISEH